MKYSFIDASIKSLYVHAVGNKLEEEGCSISEKAIALDADLEPILLDFFLKHFKTEQHYNFYHDADLYLNEIYTYIGTIFNDFTMLGEQSKNIAKHLYNCSEHPKIKRGELYVVYFKDCEINNEKVDAIGLFKTENKDVFLDIERTTESFDIEPKEGIDIKKLDKGCLVYNVEKDNGYLVAVVDNTNKNNEAQYWKDDFLQLLIKNNDFNQTSNFLNLTKQFVSAQLTEEFEVSRADEIDLLNKSVNYFKTHDNFVKAEFETQVLEQPEIIESFQNFDETYRQENQIDYDENFDISKQAVKKQARIFKSILKLDKNFHVYIHGNRDMIEQGTDENGRKFYKLYYQSES